MQQSTHKIVLVEQPIEIDILKNKKALHILRAINHPLRLKMIKVLDENQQMTVTQIFTTLQLDQAVASQHLAVLRKAGFVGTKKESKFVYYALNYNYINHFTNTIQILFNDSIFNSK